MNKPSTSLDTLVQHAFEWPPKALTIAAMLPQPVQQFDLPVPA
jgi:hypothetical protein